MSNSTSDSPLAAVAEAALLRDGPRHDWDGPALLFTVQRGTFGQPTIGRVTVIPMNPRNLSPAALTRFTGELILSDPADAPCGFGLRVESWHRWVKSSEDPMPLPGGVADQLDAYEVSMCWVADMHGATHTACRARRNPDHIDHGIQLAADTRIGRVLIDLATCAANLNTLHRSDHDKADNRLLNTLNAAGLSRPQPGRTTPAPAAENTSADAPGPAPETDLGPLM